MIGASQESIDEKSEFLNRLGKLAYPAPLQNTNREGTTSDQEKYSSRFFFTTPDDYAEENKYSVGLQQLKEEPFNLEILQRVEHYKENVGSPVKFNIDLVSEFILNELTPLLLGLDGGVEQARSVIHTTVGDIDPYPITVLELLTREAVKLKLSKFITQYFDIDESEAEKLVAKIMPPKQREVVVPVPMEGSKYGQRKIETPSGDRGG